MGIGGEGAAGRGYSRCVGSRGRVLTTAMVKDDSQLTEMQEEQERHFLHSSETATQLWVPCFGGTVRR